jgi:peptide/nickel transport system permease protein
MTRYVIRRAIQVPFLFLGVSLVTFLLVHLAPGSPIDDLRVSVPGISNSDLQRIERSLGIDRPLQRQYLDWLGQLAKGDLGLSLTDRRPVRDTIIDRLPATMLLMGTSLLVSLLISVPVGVIAAVKRNSWFDQIANALATLSSALPTFWIGLLLILAFSVQAQSWGLPMLPSSGMREVIGGGDFTDRLKHLILPVATMSFIQISGWIRYVRAQMLEVLGQDYIRTARSKGLRERSVINRHAFRNALLPLVTLIGVSLPELVIGAPIIESIFSWPGIGALSIQAAQGHDYTMVIGITVFAGLATLTANLLTDVAYAVVDPRITYE